jgi:hypothetical protein
LAPGAALTTIGIICQISAIKPLHGNMRTLKFERHEFAFTGYFTDEDCRCTIFRSYIAMVGIPSRWREIVRPVMSPFPYVKY